jgi:cytochrome d ubiquinol oxidase subunit I
MQTPAGYAVVGEGIKRKAVMTNFFQAAFNPSMIPRYAHTIDAVLITGGFMAAAIGAYYLLKGTNKEFGRRSISYGLAVAAIFSLLMGVTGHFQAVEVVEQQPVKMAAMEGHWNTGPMPLGALGWVDTANKKTYAIEIPGGVSFLATYNFSTPYPGLNDYAKDPVKTPAPPIQVTYQTYHLMIIVYLLLMVTSLGYWWLNRTGKREKSPGLLKVLMWLWILPELGIQMGWAAAEIGRQPWIVQGLMRTSEGVSVVVPAWQIGLTIAFFFTIYALLFLGWLRVVLRMIKNGPKTATTKA